MIGWPARCGLLFWRIQMSSITIQSLVSAAIKSGDSFAAALVALQSHPAMAKAIKGGRESVASLLLPLVAAHYRIALVDGQRGKSFDKADTTAYETARKRHQRLVRAMCGHAVSMKETKKLRMTETRRQYVAKISKAIAGLSKADARMLCKMAIEAIE